MAKLQIYKFVNPGSATSASPVVTAARSQTLATNRLGATVTSIGSLVTDLEKIAIAQIKNDKLRVQAERRAERRRLDAAAEETAEANKAARGKGNKPKGKLGQKLKAGAKTGLSWIDNFLGPIGNFLLRIAAFAVTTEILEWMSDPENVEKLTTFIEKTQFVFDKIVGFGKSIGDAIGSGLDFIFGKETTIEERLAAFGQIAAAIGGIAGTLAAVSGLKDLFGGGDNPVPDSGRRPQPDGPERPRKPTPTNPSGANPDAPGPRGRPSAPDVKAKYGDAAEKAYKKVLSERGDDAARAFLGELENTGGSVSKAQSRFNRLTKKGRFPKIEPPKPTAMQRLGNFFGGIRDSAVKQGTRLKNFAVDQGGRLLKSLQGLPGWAVNQYNNLSTAARKKWDDVSKVGQMIAEKGNKWASAAGNKLKAAGNWVVDGGKKALNGLASGAKNFFLEKIMTPLKPIIDPIAKTASKIGQGLFDALMKIPGADKILEVLKKKGINGMGDIATAGSKLGKRAAAILPVIGGIVNLAFAYDRAANGDSIGALIEGTSGILDIAGLATAGAGSVVSMLLDGYMFARDFIPQLQQGEEAIVDAVGARGLKTAIDNILSKLPNIGEIINMFMGKSNQTPETNPGGHQEPGQTLAQGGRVRRKTTGGIINWAKDRWNDITGGGRQPSGSPAPAAPRPAPKPTSAPGGLPPWIKDLIKAHEGRAPGYRKNYHPAYLDSKDLPTIGYGHLIIPGDGYNMSSVLTDAQADALFDKDFAKHLAQAQAVPGYKKAGPLQKAAIVDLVYNMGGSFYHSWPNFSKAFREGNYQRAADELYDSAWRTQVGPRRSVPIINLMRGDGLKGGDSDHQQIRDKYKLRAAAGNTELASLSSDLAIQQEMDFVPVPMIIEKLVPLPQAVAINTGGGVVSAAPTSLTSRMQG